MDHALTSFTLFRRVASTWHMNLNSSTCFRRASRLDSAHVRDHAFPLFSIMVTIMLYHSLKHQNEDSIEANNIKSYDLYIRIEISYNKNPRKSETLLTLTYA